nr:hypothetical protein [Tanacetum cinerariifolium]
MQKRRNDVKVRTTLLLALPDEHQLRFSKYKTAQELGGAILKTFGRNEAIKKTKKNQLKQNDLDTLSLDDVYNHLKVYEPKVQKKSKPNSQNMAFISSANTSSGKEKVNTASIPTASTQVSPASADVAATSISHDNVCAYIASQSNGFQIKYEDINQINEDDIEEIDIKWNMALLSMRADRFWKKTGKKITIQENHALVADDEAPTEFALMAKSSSSYENEEIKFCEKIRGIEFDVKNKNTKIKNLMNELEHIKKEKEGLDSKLTGFESASKDLDTLLGSQRSDKNKEGLGYSAVPPPAQVYSPPKKDMSWTGLPKFADDTITDYNRPSPSIESNSSDLQNSSSSVSEHGESSESIISKPMIKFVKAANCAEVKTNKAKAARKPSIKHA